MVALYRRDTWDPHGVYHIAQISVAMSLPIVAALGPFMLKLTPLHSQLDTALALRELNSIAPIAPVETALSSSLMLVSFGLSTIPNIGMLPLSGSWELLELSQ